MPELPEVECVRLGLNTLLEGEIRSAQTNYPPLWDKESLELASLIGQQLKVVERKGKYLRLLFDEFQFLIHLGMSGVLLCNQAARPHTHMEIHFADGQQLLYSDPRKFGYLHLAKRGQKLERWENLGPDALSSGCTASFFYEKIRRSKSSIKQLLLDQSKIAGVGNIYASEALFSAKINPFRTGQELSLAEVELLVKAVKKIMKSSVKNRGTTFSDYRLTNGKGGAFQNFLKVFQKENEPCPKCQNPILKAVQNKRSTFFCLQCQGPDSP